MRNIFNAGFFLTATLGHALAALTVFYNFCLSTEAMGSTMSNPIRYVADTRLPLDFTIVGVFVGALILFFAEQKERHFSRSKRPMWESKPILWERAGLFAVFTLGSVSLSLFFGDAMRFEMGPYVSGSIFLSLATLAAMALAPSGSMRRFALVPIIVMAAVGVFELVENQTTEYTFHVAEPQVHSIEF